MVQNVTFVLSELIVSTWYCSVPIKGAREVSPSIHLKRQMSAFVPLYTNESKDMVWCNKPEKIMVLIKRLHSQHSI